MSGVVTLSMEVELGWGVHDIGDYAHLSDDGAQEREYLGRLLDCCDEIDVPITFDVVGHLCQSACCGNHDGPHESDWFDADPGTDVTADPLFYAPDVVDEIDGRRTDHELASHTFSHVMCNRVGPETVSWELAESQTVLRRTTGSKTVSLVPPRHSRPPTAPLRAADIEITRMSRDTSDKSRRARLKELLIGPHPLFDPVLVDGVVETYCTSYPSLTSSALPAGQRAPLAPFSAVPVRMRQSLQRRYLRRAVEVAIEEEGYCHLWCHLYDLSNEYQWPVVRAFLRALAAMRDRGDVRVLTMEQLNDHVREKQHTEVPVRA